MVNRINGTSGDDTITGTDDDDDIRGRSGDDSLSGGEGDDTLRGASGSDTLEGDEGDDDLRGGAQSDLLRGGDGDDRLTGASGADTLEGGDGDDEIEGGSQNDVVWGGDGEDTITGDSGADLISGGADDDVIEGGDGADSLFGGFGDDTIIGGTGNDWLEGFGGDDLIDAGEFAGGSDTIVFSPGFGNDTIDGFNPDTDFIHIGEADPADVTFSATGDPKIWVVTIDGSPNDSLTLDFTFFFDDSLDEDDLGARVLSSVDEPIPDDPYGVPICLTAGIKVETARGHIPAAQLCVGDLVRTLDAGWQPIQAVLRNTFPASEMATNPALCPVVIPAGAFGGGLPHATMRVSLQHGFLAVDERDPSREVMIRARHLADCLGLAEIDVAPDRSETYVHLLLHGHHVIRAEGVWTETIFTGPRALAADPVLARLVAGRELPMMAARARPLLPRRAMREWTGYTIGRAAERAPHEPYFIGARQVGCPNPSTAQSVGR